ncbi:mechanosensitive ion channel family protein [Sphingobacterium deserti]|uniref:Mechanosensitive ion channel periplasmic binding protein n=1 Tax=Sphingobacterium deserti TaxID=1229276 RepID=A0A0B8SZ94_9SPHI|nr:mechanosensitive ion channel domain-containing protein [Sphingobacterium deserti]KGE12711.1 mechanosensitive ion channel periplasmic binding protein [Sphingobacterium deserti]
MVGKNVNSAVQRRFIQLIICILLAIPSSLWAQIQDSIDQQNALEQLDERRGQVREWSVLVGRVSRQVDSTKRLISWSRERPDSARLDSALQVLAVKKKDIISLTETIKSARTVWLSEQRAPTSLDSNMVEDLAANDSIRLAFSGTRDSLDRMENTLKRLMSDVLYLEESAGRQREEVSASAIDSTISKIIPVPRRVIKTVRTNMGRDGSSTAFFDYPAWSSRIFLILISLLYFYWMYRLGRETEQEGDELPLHRNDPIWIPILKCIIFFLVLLPFVTFTVPVLVLEFSYFLVFIFLYIILFKELSAFKRRALHFVFLYYVLLIVSNLLLSELWWSRIFAMLANLSGIALVYLMGRRTDIDNPVGYMHRYARVLIMLGHLLAIVLNAVDYVSVSRMWSLATGIGFLQAMSLRAFRDMILHDLAKQYERAKAETVFKRFDLKKMLASVDRLIRIICVALIAIVFINNMHITREAGAFFEKLLTTNHKVGSITFTYGDLLLAIAVVWIANWLQKNLKNLVNDPANDELHARKMTLFPLFRLLIFVVGFLIGISILGLGMDKLTVIIGALSVGIGLGMQNIINNFVSGIILVFEKPFKIGDYVELADKKGQVMQIGIRSSTLLTDQGARVIIPNGDLLSGRLVNWTFSDSDIRMNMQLTVENKGSIDGVKKQVEDTLRTFNEVDLNIPIKVLTKDVTPDNYILTVQVGIKHVRYIEKFRSQFLEALKGDLDGREIKVSSS